MEFVISTLSISSLYSLLVSILTMCIMYYGLNKFTYLVNVFIYMFSKILLTFIIIKFLYLIVSIDSSVKITFADFIIGFILGLIIAKILGKFADGSYSIGIFVTIGVIVETIVIFVFNLILGIFI